MLNRICFTICMACLVIGVVAAIAIIWLPDAGEYAWKSFLTLGVLFGASSVTPKLAAMLRK